MAEKRTLHTANRIITEQAIEINRLQKIIDKQHHQLAIAQIDGLTGLLRPEGFKDNVEKELSRSRRTGHHLSVFVLDLNNLKTVNDNHGHNAGDEMLKGFASLLKKSVRAGDTVARTGGDEFMILLPEQNKAMAELAKKKLLKKIDAGKESLQYFFGAAVGLASTSQGFKHFESLYEAADMAMYKHTTELKKEVTPA